MGRLIFRAFWMAVLLGATVETATTRPTPPPSSSLHLISEDFRILSRITNAIYLQSETIKKSMKVRDFLADFLHIPTEEFNQLMSFNITTAKNEINRIHLEHSKLFPILKKRANARKDVVRIRHPFVLLERLQNSEIENSSRIHSSTLINEAKLIKSHPIFETKCAEIDHKNLLEFRKFFSLSIPDDNKIKPIIEEFSKQASTIRNCLNGSEVLEKKILENQKLLEMSKQYQPVRNLLEFAFQFAGSYDSTYNGIPEYINQASVIFGQTKTIWDQKNRPKSLESTMNSLFDAVELMYDRSASDTQNFIGFKGTDDYLKVFDDLNSSWFKGKIAKGASTENLENALKPFQKIMKSALVLLGKWRELMNSKSVHIEFYLGVEKMAEVARFKDQDLTILGKWKSEIKECFQKSKLDLSHFSTYQDGMSATERVIRKFFEVSIDLSHLNDHLLSKATPNNNALRYYMDLLNDVTDEIDYGTKQKLPALEIFNWIRNRVDEVQKRVQDLEPLANLDFFETLENVAKLVEKMKEMKKGTKRIKGNLKTDENEIIKEMDLVNIANCLKKKKLNASNMIRRLNLLETIFGLPGKSLVDEMNQWLDSLEKVKTQMAPVEKNIKQISNSAYSKDSKNLILSLKEAKTLSQDIGANVKILEDAERIRQKRSLLTNIPQFPEEIKFLIYRAGVAQWADPSLQLKEMLGKIEKLERISGKIRNESVLEMTKIFEEAADITGISGSWTSLNQLSKSLRESHLKDKNASMNYFSDVVSLGVDLEFSNYQTRLRTSRTIVLSLVQYFDEIFGHSKPKTVTIEKHVETASLAMILGICIGMIFVILLATVVTFGLTKNGKKTYTNWWLYYFGKPQDFEKRWRYSLFMDQTNMKNSIQDAVREVNRTNLLLALKNGAYVNAYNKFGNTPLHLATKLAYPELVELLIRYGADRSLLNTENRTAQQMIPTKYQNSDKATEFSRIDQIYKKYSKSKFRISVPQKFPSTSFHIYMEDQTDNELTDKFMDQFQSITSDEPMPTTTHFVVKTDKDGVWETDRLDNLIWIFNGVIIVKEQWMAACLNDEKLIEKDSNYLVEKVKFKGTIYQGVLAWSEAMAKGKMPYLIGVYVGVVMKECANLSLLSNLVEAHGGTMMTTFPMKQNFNKTSHPYLHAHLGPLFLIHDGTIDLTIYKNDPDKMYTLFTEDEFLVFMLKRDITTDKRQNPPSVMKTVK